MQICNKLMQDLALPVLFNIIRTCPDAKDTLWESRVLPHLLELLGDQSWCVDACDCLAKWIKADPQRVKPVVLEAQNLARIKAAFSQHRRALTFSKVLSVYTTFVQSAPAVAGGVISLGLVPEVLDAAAHEKKPFVRTALLRLLRALCASADAPDAPGIRQAREQMALLSARETSALARSLAREIVSTLDTLLSKY